MTQETKATVATDVQERVLLIQSENTTHKKTTTVKRALRTQYANTKKTKKTLKLTPLFLVENGIHGCFGMYLNRSWAE